MKAQWSNIMEAWSGLCRLEYFVPYETCIILCQKFASDQSSKRQWKKYGSCLAIADNPGWTSNQLNNFSHEKPTFQDTLPDAEAEHDEECDEVSFEYDSEHYHKACWNSGVFQLVEEVSRPEMRDQLVVYSREVLAVTASLKDLPIPVQDMLTPVRHFALAMLATLCGMPFEGGSTPEDVWYVFGDPNKKKKPVPFAAFPAAAAIAAELRRNEVWIQILDEYCSFTGTEHAYGAEFLLLNKRGRDCIVAVQAEEAAIKVSQADSQATPGEDKEMELDSMKEVLELLKEFADSIAWYRENFREGSTYPLEREIVPELLDKKWTLQLGEGSCTDMKNIKEFKSLATACGSETLAQKAHAAMVRQEQGATSSAIEASAQKDLKKIPNMMSFVEALRRAEHSPKSEEAITAMKAVYDNFAKCVCAALESKDIREHVLQKMFSAPKIMLEDSHFADKFLCEKEVLTQEVSSLQSIATNLGAFREAASELQKASASTDDNSDEAIRNCVFNLHSAMKTVETMTSKPPKFRDASPWTHEVEAMLKLGGDWSSKGGKDNAGAKGVLKKHCTSVAHKTLDKLQEMADSLAKIAGGGKEEGSGWKQNLRANSSWSKLEDAWNEHLANCSQDSIENESRELKTDTPSTLSHVPCPYTCCCKMFSYACMHQYFSGVRQVDRGQESL